MATVPAHHPEAIQTLEEVVTVRLLHQHVVVAPLEAAVVMEQLRLPLNVLEAVQGVIPIVPIHLLLRTVLVDRVIPVSILLLPRKAEVISQALLRVVFVIPVIRLLATVVVVPPEVVPIGVIHPAKQEAIAPHALVPAHPTEVVAAPEVEVVTVLPEVVAQVLLPEVHQVEAAPEEDKHNI